MKPICPSCRAELGRVHLDPCDVDVCPTCGGVWFDRGELGRAIASRGETLAALARPARGPVAELVAPTGECPLCRDRLAPFVLGGSPPVRAERCPKCQGVWLDAVSIRQIGARQAARRVKAPASRAPAVAPGPRPEPGVGAWIAGDVAAETAWVAVEAAVCFVLDGIGGLTSG